MAKTSEETRNKITIYSKDKGLRLDIADLCISVEEVDTVFQCYMHVMRNKLDYLTAKGNAPHNVSANLKAYNKELSKATTEEEENEIHFYTIQQYPLSSDVLDIKNEIFNYCKERMKESNIGRKRIKKILTFLRDALLDEEEGLEDLELFIEGVNKHLPGFL